MCLIKSMLKDSGSWLNVHTICVDKVNQSNPRYSTVVIVKHNLKPLVKFEMSHSSAMCLFVLSCITVGSLT